MTAAAAGPDGVARLRGVVRSPDGWPLGDAVVTVLGPAGGQAGRGRTDSTGGFSVDVRASGAVTLVVAAPGVPPSAVQAITASGRVTDVGPVVLGRARTAGLPDPGTYDVDPAHTVVRATGRHLGLSRVEGRFTRFDGVLEVAERPEDSRAALTIDATSITTADDGRDAHLRSADFLDVAAFPALAFTSTHVRPVGERWEVGGRLRIRDVERPVRLDVAFLGSGEDAFGGRRIAFAGSTVLARDDYAMRWNMGLPGGLTVLGPTLQVDLDVQAVRREA